MRRMVWVILAISLLGLSGAAQQSVPTAPQLQASPAGTHRSVGSPGRTQSSLTNADVVRLVKAGVGDSTIISSIQSSPTKFDLSPDALIALHNSGVSQAVLDVMMADGSAQKNGGNAPGGTTALPAKPGSRLKARLKLSAPKTGPKVTNAAANQTHAVIIAVLDKQRQAANMEAAQMVRTTARPAPVLAGPTHPMMASGTGSPSVGTTGTAPPGMLGASQPHASSGNMPASITHVQPMQSVALPCAQNPSIRIFNVSGNASPSTFTTDPKYNFYTITGCSFGDPGPNSKVYIYYQGSFHQDFQVQQWSDNGIKLNLDPALTGVLDQDNLTLVVQRNDGKQASKGGFKFYAARATTRLALIPKNSFSLNQFTLNNKTYLPSSVYTSPSSPKVIPNIGGWTSEVQWTSTDPSWDKMDPGEDIYQFKQLQPGFALDSAQMTWVNLDCVSSDNYQFVNLGGNFGLQWVGDDLHAKWQAQYCKPINCGGTFQSDCFASSPESNYAVDVWVTGPRGVDPWTGKPN